MTTGAAQELPFKLGKQGPGHRFKLCSERPCLASASSKAQISSSWHRRRHDFTTRIFKISSSPTSTTVPPTLAPLAMGRLITYPLSLYTRCPACNTTRSQLPGQDADRGSSGGHWCGRAASPGTIDPPPATAAPRHIVSFVCPLQAPVTANV